MRLLILGLLLSPSLAFARLDKEVKYTIGHHFPQSLSIRSYSSPQGNKAYGLILFKNERPQFLKTITPEDYQNLSSRIELIFPKVFLNKPRILANNCSDSLTISSGKKKNRICLSDLSEKTQKDFTNWWLQAKTKAQK